MLQRKTYFLLIFNILIFGTNFIFTKQLIPPLNSFSFLCLRSLIGVIVLLIIILAQQRGHELMDFLKHNPKFCLDIFLFYTLSNVLIYFGTALTTATNQVIIQNFGLVIVVLINSIVFHAKPKRNVIISVGLTTIGIFLVMWPIFGSNPNLLGDLLTLSGVVLSATFGIKQKKILEKTPPIFMAFIMALVTTVSMLPFAIFLGNLQNIVQFSVTQWIFLFWLGIGIAGLGYTINSAVFKDPGVTPEIMGILSSLTPVFGILVSVIVFGETIGVINIFGAILVIISIYLAQLSEKTSDKAKPPIEQKSAQSDSSQEK